MSREITIIGGGIAGLTLGILLRRRDVVVCIHEAGSYPRHRVCGEFISGDGLEIVRDLVEVPSLLANTVQFFHGPKSSGIRSLPVPALSASRYHLDHALAREFSQLGGSLIENSRWEGDWSSPGLIRCTGRRIRKSSRRGNLAGLKIHVRNLRLNADLELHFASAGYAGLSRLPGGEVNVCGLFLTRGTLRDVRRSVRRIFQSVLAPERGADLENAELMDDTFCAVAGLDLGHNPSSECSLGDSICMIPPLTGNGMSLAFESARLAAPALAEFSSGGLTWPEAAGEISQKCEKTFQRRLRVSSILQKILFSRAGRCAVLSSIRTIPGMLEGYFAATR